MTQQVDEMMLHMDDSDSSDDDNKVGSNDKNNDANYTHPAAATKSGRNEKQKLMLMDSGDVLATISKVKRRRRHIENDRRQRQTRPMMIRATAGNDKGLNGAVAVPPPNLMFTIVAVETRYVVRRGKMISKPALKIYLVTLAGVEVVDQSQRKRKRSRMRCKEGAFGKFILLHERDCHWCSDEPKTAMKKVLLLLRLLLLQQRLLNAVPTPTTTTGMDAATTTTFCCSTSQSEFSSGSSSSSDCDEETYLQHCLQGIFRIVSRDGWEWYILLITMSPLAK
eukprot:scaffold2093_cov219-Skeletonema_menzelii.AAC.7